LKVTDNCYAIIKHFEGCRLKPYLCSSNVPTIGWGNTFYPNGKKVTLKDAPITLQRADEILKFTVSLFEKEVVSLFPQNIAPNKFDALVSFAYNVGSDIDQDEIPEGLGDSTLLKKIISNQNDPTIWGEFLLWNKSGGKEKLGLTRRRNCEAHLYFKNELNYYEKLLK